MSGRDCNMNGHKCDIDKLKTDVVFIIGWLWHGKMTVKGVMREYGCNYDTLMDVILNIIDINVWRKIRRQQYKRGARKAWVTRRKGKL